MDYQMKTLGAVATYINGRAFRPIEWEEYGKKIIRIQNLTDPRAKYNYSSQEYDNRFLVKKGDLLFSWSATLSVHIWNDEDAWLNQHIFKVIPNESIDKKYLYYFLIHTITALYAKTHGSGMVHITKEPFMNTPIPVPPLPEQQRIVARIEELFSQLDAGVETLKKTKQQLEVYRQAVLKEAFDSVDTSFYHPLRTVILGSPQNGLYKPKSDYNEDGTPILRIDGFYNGFVLSDYSYKRVNLSAEEIERYGLELGDLVVNRVNSMPYLGKCALIRSLLEPTVFESNMMRIKLNANIVIGDWLIYYLTSYAGKKELTKNAKQAVNQASINQTDVGNTYVPIPSRDVQQRLVRLIESRLSACDNIEQTVDTVFQQARAMRQSILKQAYEGEII